MLKDKIRNLSSSLTFKPLHLLNGISFNFPFTPKQIILFFLAASFAITALEVALCHSQNNFRPRYEWIPIIYCLMAAAITCAYLFKSKCQLILQVYRLTMVLGMLVGIAGVLFHLFGNITVKNPSVTNWFIHGIPVLAPLAITGMTLFGLAVVNSTPQRLVRLVALGFLVIALTSSFDHAQTGFKAIYTLFPLVAGMLGFSVTWLCSRHITNDNDRPSGINTETANLFYAVMLMMIVTGIVGFGLHLSADLHATVVFPPVDRLLYHAPVLAPMLFAQLGTLGILSSITVVRQDCYQQNSTCNAKSIC